MNATNSLLAEHGDALAATHSTRDSLLVLLNDADLAFRVPHNPTLGALFRELGEVQQSYLDSFRTFTQDFSYRQPDPAVETSVATLSNWFQQLDADLMAVLAALSEEEVSSKTIDRGGFQPSPSLQVDIYVQAVMIFYGKATIYFRAMQKPLPDYWAEWIG